MTLTLIATATSLWCSKRDPREGVTANAARRIPENATFIVFFGG